MSPLDLAFMAFMSAVLIKIIADFNNFMNDTGLTFTEEIRELFKKCD